MRNRHGAGRAAYPLGLRPGCDEDAGAAPHAFEELREETGGSQMKIFVAGGRGATKVVATVEDVAPITSTMQ